MLLILICAWISLIMIGGTYFYSLVFKENTFGDFLFISIVCIPIMLQSSFIIFFMQH